VERGPDPRVFHTPMIFPHRLIIPPLGPGRVSVFGR
jgi:hypothetical protein